MEKYPRRSRRWLACIFGTHFQVTVLLHQGHNTSQRLEWQLRRIYEDAAHAYWIEAPGKGLLLAERSKYVFTTAWSGIGHVAASAVAKTALPSFRKVLEFLGADVVAPHHSWSGEHVFERQRTLLDELELTFPEAYVEHFIVVQPIDANLLVSTEPRVSNCWHELNCVR